LFFTGDRDVQESPFHCRAFFTAEIAEGSQRALRITMRSGRLATYSLSSIRVILCGN
jgi:hypothetical protein